MSHAYLGIGSNTDRERNIASCLMALRKRFGRLVVSPVYQCPAVGFQGEDFYNLVVGVETDMDPVALNRELHAIEDAHGRDRSGPRFSDRTLDIDLLLYDGLVLEDAGVHVPRPEILNYAFVLKPLADIAPDLVHPVEKRSLSALWEAFTGPRDEIRPVEMLGPSN